MSESLKETQVLYITYAKLQSELKSAYFRYGKRVTFAFMLHKLFCDGALSKMPHQYALNEWDNKVRAKDFNKIIDKLDFPLVYPLVHQHELCEKKMIPSSLDSLVIRRFAYTAPSFHTHDYFEIDFCCEGECSLFFDKKEEKIKSGDVVIIAPDSEHDITIQSDECTVYCALLRKSTLNTSFYPVILGNDILSRFFLNALQKKCDGNYLKFKTKVGSAFENHLRCALVECSRRDSYSICAVNSYLTLALTDLMRNHAEEVKVHDFLLSNDFSVVLQYIMNNYKSATLAQTADFFHYSEPHLSSLIHKNTGYRFTELIQQLKLRDASILLETTDMKVEEVAQSVGYSSAERLSRVFRAKFALSPVEYRKIKKKKH